MATSKAILSYITEGTVHGISDYFTRSSRLPDLFSMREPGTGRKLGDRAEEPITLWATGREMTASCQKKIDKKQRGAIG